MNNHPAVTVDPTARMTSLEIAELTGKNHQHVVRDIRDLIEQEAISLSSFGQSTYTNSRNQQYPMYTLDFRATMTLVTGYDAKRRAIVIDRWVKLETGEATPALAGNSALDAMAGQVIAMVIPAVLSQVMGQVAPLVEEIKAKVSQVQINFNQCGTVWSFHYHCCQEGNTNTFCPKDELYAAYCAYCATIPYCRPDSKTGFLVKLYRAFVNTCAATINQDGRKVQTVRGLALLPGYQSIIADLQARRRQQDADEVTRRRVTYCGVQAEDHEETLS